MLFVWTECAEFRIHTDLGSLNLSFNFPGLGHHWKRPWSWKTWENCWTCPLADADLQSFLDPLTDSGSLVDKILLTGTDMDPVP